MKKSLGLLAFIAFVFVSCETEVIAPAAVTLQPNDTTAVVQSILSMENNPAQLNDSLFGFRYLKVKNHITNHSATVTNYTWEVVSNSSTAALRLLACDPYTCLPPNTLKSNFTLAKDSTGVFEIGFMHTNTTLTKETRLIETITLKVLVYPIGEKEKAITYTAIVNCI